LPPNASLRSLSGPPPTRALCPAARNCLMNPLAMSTLINPHIDKSGAELDRQRFQMLEDIARELSGDVVFPTSFDVILRLRKDLQDPEISLRKITSLITLEPLLSARVVALANSAFYNPGSSPVRDLQRAVERIGLQAVRTTSLAIAMKQLLLARDVVSSQVQADRLWQHSLRSASAAYVLAKNLTRINPDEALVAGMIHDIGAFYMIHRASQYEELVLRPESTKYLVIRWHESVGHALAIALGLPEQIADAMLDHDQPRPTPEPPRTLVDIVYLSNLLAGGKFEWLDIPPETAASEMEKIQVYTDDFGEEIDAHEASIRAAFD
jgi:HD-like signal output (HDOD) protein